MNFIKSNTIYIVELHYDTKYTKYKKISRYRYYSLEKAENAARLFKIQLKELIYDITITSENLEIL